MKIIRYLDRGGQYHQHSDDGKRELGRPERRLLHCTSAHRPWMAGGWWVSGFAVIVNLATAESWTTRRSGRPPGPSWPPYPFAAAGSGDRGGGDGHRGGGVCVGRQWCPSAVQRIISERVNEEIAVPPVGSSAAVADSAACVTSTCGGGGGGRRRNDVNN